MKPQNKTQKINKTEFMHLTGVSYPTALKDYKVILDSLAIKNRNYLTINDLQKYGLL